MCAGNGGPQTGLRQITGCGITVTTFIEDADHRAAIDASLRRLGDILPHTQLFSRFLDESERAEINGGNKTFEG